MHSVSNLAPLVGIEPTLIKLEVQGFIQLSYRGMAE